MENVLKAIEMLSKDKNCELDANILKEAKKELEDGLKALEDKKKTFDYEMDIKQRSFDASLRLFNAKWKILEEETRRLAEDKKKAEKRRAFFERVNSFENNNYGNKDSGSSIGHLFFKGVNSQQSLKKRYRELLKIYHPDEESGDMMTIQEINKEYDLLKQSLFN